MEEDDQRCPCGRTFSHANAFTYHQRTCRKSKKRLAGALALAKQAWIQRKKTRLVTEDGSQVCDRGDSADSEMPMVCYRIRVVYFKFLIRVTKA
jgi:hypothetical protein